MNNLRRVDSLRGAPLGMTGPWAPVVQKIDGGKGTELSIVMLDG